MRLAKALMTTVTGLHNLLCALPLLCVMNLYALVGRLAMLIGHWPRIYDWYDNEAVDHIAEGDWLYRLLEQGIGWLVVSAILSVPLWLVFTICLRGRYSLGGRWGRVALYGLGWLACVGLVIFDPGRFFAWLMF